MKLIRKKSIATLPEINGSVVDTFNVIDKVTNAPSIRAVEEKLSYSTEETIIGKWHDGTTKYRKVFYTTTRSTTNTGEMIDISGLNIEKNKIEGWVETDIADVQINSSNYINCDTSRNSMYCNVYYHKVQKKLFGTFGTDLLNKPITIILTYSKKSS